ncbi:hypothetical protein A7L71_18950 [Acinetobacter baumannii]|nr:hypothetical protein A7L71_18950 [Acinetobacter baumannii]
MVSNIVQRCLLGVETVIALTKANAPRRATPSGWSSSLKPPASSTRIWKVQRTTANAEQAASATVAPATTDDGAHNMIDYNNSTTVLRRPSI